MTRSGPPGSTATRSATPAAQLDRLRWYRVDGRLVRTLRCPDAVNGRTATSAGLALGAVTVVTVGEVVALRRTRWSRSFPSGPARRLRLLGTVAAILGGMLTVGGLAGIAVLVGDPSSPLFLYVSRPLAVFVGLLLLLPAMLLIAVGYGIRLMANYLAHAEPPNETS